MQVTFVESNSNITGLEVRARSLRKPGDLKLLSVLYRTFFVQPRSMRRFRCVASLVIFVAALLVFLAVASNRRDIVTLPGGLTVQWLGVTEGTNALIDGNILQKLLGDGIPAKGINLGFATLTRPRKFESRRVTGHVVWFRLSGKDPSSPSYEPLGHFRKWRGFQVFFRNQSGRELEVPHPMPYTISSTNAVFAIAMNAYPRDKPNVTMRIGTPPDGKTEQQWAEFEFKTPARVKQLPAWSLRSLPATSVVDGFAIVLRSASASSATLDLILPSADWTAPESTILDQEGNRYSMSKFFKSSPPRSDCSISFPGTFGENYPWNARLTFVNARGFVKQPFHHIPEPNFPEHLLRRLTLAVGAPPVSITNSIGQTFSCVLKNGQITIRGNTGERPYWVLVSATDGLKQISDADTGWSNPDFKNPFEDQHFSLFRNVSNLIVELACPQVISTEFYFQPAE